MFQYHFFLQEQYSNTLFFTKTSNKDFVAKVSGTHPGTLMSRFFWDARWLKIYSNLFVSSSYWAFRSFKSLFLSSFCLSSSFIWCFMVLVLLSWIDFNSSISFLFVFSIPSICSFKSRFNSFSFSFHLEKFSLASLLSSFSVFSRKSTFSSVAFIYCPNMEIFSLSSTISLSFSLFSSWSPLIVVSNCLVFKSWSFFRSSISYSK